MINVVTKRPLSTPFYALEQQFGNYDFYRTAVDATGPLNEDKTLLYRATLQAVEAGSFGRSVGPGFTTIKLPIGFVADRSPSALSIQQRERHRRLPLLGT